MTVTTADQSLLAEFSGGSAGDVEMMIGIGLVKDSDAVFFQYMGEEQTKALMLDSGKPLTRLANVTLTGISIAEDVGEFKSTKLNLYLQSSQGRVIMLTSGLATIWSQCVLTALQGLYANGGLTDVFTLDTWKGNSKMRPCFAAIRQGREKVSDQLMYDALRDARADRDTAKIDALLRDTVSVVGKQINVEDTVVSEVDPEAAEIY